MNPFGRNLLASLEGGKVFENTFFVPQLQPLCLLVLHHNAPFF